MCTSLKSCFFVFKTDLLALFFTCLSVMTVFARPVTSNEAARATVNWLGRNHSPLNVSFASSAVREVRMVNDESGTCLFHVVRLEGGGTVVTSAESGIVPVIAFTESNDVWDSPENPLWRILKADISRRNAIVDSIRKATVTRQTTRLLALSDNGVQDEIARSEAAWSALLSDNSTPLKKYSAVREVASAKLSAKSTGSQTYIIDDVLVPPLIKTSWGQSTVSDFTDGVDYCYNYYTPYHYVCGCVATSMSQVMRYHRFPTGAVPYCVYTCYYGNENIRVGIGGYSYDWENMPLDPALEHSLTENQCKAIGRLCFDAGLAAGVHYEHGGSGCDHRSARDALIDMFGYASARITDHYTGSHEPYGHFEDQLQHAICANLDAGFPVIIGIKTDDNDQHSVIGDGYGYKNGVRYVHLNMGWCGKDDAWYNLPDVDAISNGYYFDYIFDIVHNIFPTQTGKLITGRIYDTSFLPVSGATVTASGNGESVSGQTNTNGIYSLFVVGDKNYSVQATAGTSTSSTLSVSDFHNAGCSSGNELLLTMPIPEIPSGVTVSAGTSTSKVFIAWNEVPWARAYSIWRLEQPSGEARFLSSEITETSFVDTAVSPGVTYQYCVAAWNSSGSSGYSSWQSGYSALSAPNLISAVGTSAGVRLSWNEVAGALFYKVYRATSLDGQKTPVGSWLNTTSVIDVLGEVETTYYYFVCAAVDSYGLHASDYSNCKSGSRRVAVPDPVCASDGSSTENVTISWNSSPGATSYVVYRDTVSPPITVLANGITSTRFTDTTAVPGILYYYSVKAFAGYNPGDSSAPDSGYRKLSAPIISSALCTTSKVSLECSCFAGARYVRFYRSATADGPQTELGPWQYIPVGSSMVSCSDTTGDAGVTYYYFARTAMDSSGLRSSDISEPLAATKNIPLEIALDNPSLYFITGGATSWCGRKIRTHDGNGAARSGVLNDDQLCWMETTLNNSEPVLLSFWWLVSSESENDFLSFSIDGNEVARISGTSSSWMKFTYALTGGYHKCLWTYSKNSSIAEGDDAGYVDEFSLVPIPDNGEIINGTVWYYEITGTDAVITGCSQEYGAMVIPSELCGCVVSAIADNAFTNKNNIMTVTIPDGVTSIGDSAFSGCSRLSSISIPSTVINIEENAFYGCDCLKAVFVDTGDADRIKVMLRNSEFDIADVYFGCEEGWTSGKNKRSLVYYDSSCNVVWDFDYDVADVNAGTIILRKNDIGGADKLDLRNLPGGYKVIDVDTVFDVQKIIVDTEDIYRIRGVFDNRGFDTAEIEFCCDPGWVVEVSNCDLSFVNEFGRKLWDFDFVINSSAPTNLVLTTKNIGTGDLDMRGLPDGYRVIDVDSVFSNDTSLTSVYLPDLESVQRDAFNGCTSLTDLHLPKAKGVGKFGIANCHSLTNVTIGELSMVEDFAFQNANDKLAVHVLAGGPPGSFGYQSFNTQPNRPEKTPLVYIYTKIPEEIQAWTKKCFALKGNPQQSAYWVKNVCPRGTIGLITVSSQYSTQYSFYLVDGNPKPLIFMVY